MDARDARPVTERNTREGIVDTALRLLDDSGLPDLSMRRLAAALGVQPSALYWHFDSKQSLLADVADRIVAGAAHVPTTGDRTADVTAVAHALRDALLAHRDGAEVVLSTQALGLGSDAAHARLAAALGTGGSGAATVLLQFILGHASLVQQRIQAARFGVIPADGDQPRTERAIAESTAADFTLGVRLVLAGLAGEDGR